MGKAISNPYKTLAALETALSDSGSERKFNAQHGFNVRSDVYRRWHKDLAGNAPVSPPTEDNLLEHLTDEQILSALSLFSTEDFAVILKVSHPTVRREIKKRKLILPPRTATPRMEALKRRNDALERGSEHLEDFLSSLRATAASIQIPDPPKLVVAANHPPQYKTPVEVILHVSDKQFGEVVHNDDTPGGNYSPEVYYHRLERWQNAVAGILESVNAASPISRIWILQGGDFVEGDDVFKNQQWHLAMDAGAQVANLAPRWANALNNVGMRAKWLNPECHVAVVSVVGNHGTPGGRSAGAVPASLNFDYLCYEMIRHCVNPYYVDWYDGAPTRDNVITHAKKAVYFEAAGHTMLLTHGDQDRGGGLVGVAVVSGQKNDLAVRVQTGINHDCHFKGHYHKPTTISSGGSGGTYWNGDWCGANNLSTGRGGGSDPTQRVYVVHPEYGISCEYPVRLAVGTRAVAPVVRL